LFATGSAGAFWRWGIEWAGEHERGYPGFSSARYFWPFLQADGWLIPLALVGVPGTVRGLREHPRDLILLLALPCAVAAFAFQRAAFAYSLLPFEGIVALFAARGFALVLAFDRRVAIPVGVLLAVIAS